MLRGILSPRPRNGYIFLSRGDNEDFEVDSTYTPSEASSCSSDVYNFPELGDRAYGMRMGKIEVPPCGYAAVALGLGFRYAIPGSVARDPLDISRQRCASPQPSEERKAMDAAPLRPAGTDEQEEIEELKERLQRIKKEINDVVNLIRYLLHLKEFYGDSKLREEMPPDVLCPFTDINHFIFVSKKQLAKLDNAKEMADVGLMQWNLKINRLAIQGGKRRFWQQPPVGAALSTYPDQGSGFRVRNAIKKAQEIKPKNAAIESDPDQPLGCFSRPYIDMLVCKQYDRLKKVDLCKRDSTWRKRITYLYRDMPVPILIKHLAGEEWLYAQIRQEFAWIYHLVLSPPEHRKEGFIKYISEFKNLDVMLHSQMKLCGVIRVTLLDMFELDKKARNTAIRDWKSWRDDEKKWIADRQLEIDLRLFFQGTFNKARNFWDGIAFF